MKVFKSKFLGFSLLFIVFTLFCSHNLYVKLESYFLETNTAATLSLYNGSFEKSENLISRDRIVDASTVADGKRTVIDTTKWQDKDSTFTYLDFKTGDAGTYVVGVSTKARNIELSAEKFNDYLIHDGVLDMLDQRTKDNKLDDDVVESYQKHVKAIYQVGDTKTDDWKTVLGYPIEFVPVSNPYESFTGETLSVQLLLDGKPLANQLVFANHLSKGHSHDHDHYHHDDGHTNDHKHDSKDHSHDHDHDREHNHDNHSHDNHDHDHEHNHDNHSHDHESESGHGHSHTDGQQLRTNMQGIVEVNLPEDGVYYLRTIHMVNVTDDETLTHESKWATLSFEVTHKHDSSTHTHDHHDHDHEDGIPTWVFIVGSLLIIGILFFIFRKKEQ